MIVPSARAVLFAGLAAVPAFVVAVALPRIWYAGLFAIALVIAAVAVDCIALALRRLPVASLDVPGAAYVGADFAVAVDAGASRHQATITHDDRLVRRGAGPLALVGVRRGIAAIEALWLRWPGVLGLAWRTRVTPVERQVAILPDIRPARADAIRLFRRDATSGAVARLDLASGGEFEALTDYRVGLDRRTIDWKASGRHGALIAKEYRIERNNDIVFAVDTGRLMCEPVDGLTRLDRALAVVLSAAFVALKLDDRVSLFGFAARPQVMGAPVAGIQSFAAVQSLAANLDYSPEETNFTLGLTTLGQTLKRRSLVLIFSEFVDAGSAELMLASVKRLAERHLVLFVVMRDAELDALVDARPETAEDVPRAVVADALLRDRRIVLTRLQRMGVDIVEARYDQLGARLIDRYLALKRADRI